MTREETVEELHKVLNAVDITFPYRLELINAIEYLSNPSLPSNLDEAAEKEIERFCSDMLNVDIIWARMRLTKKFGLQMARFGAEWMAGQGYTQEGIARPDDCEIWANIKNTDIKDGDKVVVQIRKK